MKNTFTPPYAALLGSLSVAALSLAFSAPANAIIAIQGVSGGLANPANTNSTRGWSFQVNSDIEVFSLCFWDQSPDGLSNPHIVGLWDSGQNLLTSATVQSGTNSPIVGDPTTGIAGSFRYESITPVVLTAGNTYVIGANYNTGTHDLQLIFGTPLSTAPEITYLNGAASNGSADSIVFPQTNTCCNAGFFGPNFQFQDATPVPLESDALPVVGATLFMAGGLWWKRKRAQAKAADFIAEK